MKLPQNRSCVMRREFVCSNVKGTEIALSLQTVAPMVTLKDGSDVTESLHDLPVGTALIVRRADGATMNAMWDGERLASPKKG